jgi:hypothetical protein
MTPELSIYKGAQYQHLLTFRERATGATLNLTGLAPFIFTISHPSRDEELISVTAANTNLAAGEITIIVPASSTDRLRLGPVRVGLRDVQGNPYIQSMVPVLFFSPPPP